MARVNPEKIVNHLSQEMQRALDKAVRENIPGAEFDPRVLFSAFRREVGKACAQYEQVPDDCVMV